MKTAPIVGVDIGGAYLKAAHTNGVTRTHSFAIWRNPEGLVAALRELLKDMPEHDEIAVTMTGELCDCFFTKELGVLAILHAIDEVAGTKPVRVWLTDGTFVDHESARLDAFHAAASNWLALATFVADLVGPGFALLLDIGSTTTDIIPIIDRTPMPMGRTDRERLRHGELIYTGARRTPLCALLAGEAAAEVFATSLDVHLLLDHSPEDPNNHDTADGRAATKAMALARIARTFCASITEDFSAEEGIEWARKLCRRQVALVQRGLQAVFERQRAWPTTIILSGSGEFLGRLAIDGSSSLSIPPTMSAGTVMSLTGHLGADISTAGCAYAVAQLAARARA